MGFKALDGVLGIKYITGALETVKCQLPIIGDSEFHLEKYATANVENDFVFIRKGQVEIEDPPIGIYENGTIVINTNSVQLSGVFRLNKNISYPACNKSTVEDYPPVTNYLIYPGIRFLFLPRNRIRNYYSCTVLKKGIFTEINTFFIKTFLRTLGGQKMPNRY